jgi:ribosomal protein L28
MRVLLGRGTSRVKRQPKTGRELEVRVRDCRMFVKARERNLRVRVSALADIFGKFVFGSESERILRV